MARGATYFSTLAGADVTVATAAGDLIALVVYGSAAGTTLTVKDSAANLICTINASSLDSTVFCPSAPVAFAGGLTCTASGTGGYTVIFV